MNSINSINSINSLNSINSKVQKIYEVLERGGISCKDDLKKGGVLEGLSKEEVLCPIPNPIPNPIPKPIKNLRVEKNKERLLHHLAKNGFLPKIDPKILSIETLSLTDESGDTVYSLLTKFKLLHQLPKEFLTKEVVSKKLIGNKITPLTLVQLASITGELDKIPLASLDQKTLTLKGGEYHEGDSPMVSVITIIDHKYPTSSVLESYSALLPKLLKKLDTQALKELKKIATDKTLMKSLEMINKQISYITISKSLQSKGIQKEIEI